MVFKVPLHCQGCIRRIHKLVTKTKGDFRFLKILGLILGYGFIHFVHVLQTLYDFLNCSFRG